jgi:glycosyltransferase involved in cell wall biosynthesis
MLINKEKNFISAIVYVRNQEHSVYNFLTAITEKLSENFEKYEIICVNDASTDNSVKEIIKYADNNSSKGGVISILNMSFYQGLELSMNAGVDLSIGDFVYEFDSLVLSYPAELIIEVYMHSLQGYDIVSAAPSHNKSMSRFFYTIFNKASRTQYLLRTESFRILSRRGINRVHSMSRTIPYRKAIYANCGLKTDVITYNNIGAPVIADKVVFRKQKETALDAMILYTDVAWRFSLVFSLIMMGITILTGIYTIGVYIGSRPVAGWTTTMLFLAFAFAGLFMVLAIAIKYMSLILKLNFNTQKYVIESINKLNN